MNLWRLCRQPHADLSGEGGLRVSGRWHSAGRPVIYTATEPALAVLEVRVNLDLPFELLPDDYLILRIAAEAAVEYVESLPDDPRGFGDDWLRQGRTALLQVPSVVVPQARNMLLNPAHPAAQSFTIAQATPFRFDGRLWGIWP